MTSEITRFLAVQSLGPAAQGMLIDRIPCPPHLTHEDAKAITQLLEGAGLMLGLGVLVKYQIVITEDPNPALQESLRKSYPTTKEREHMPKLTPEIRAEALERGAKERNALLDNQKKSFGY